MQKSMGNMQRQAINAKVLKSEEIGIFYIYKTNVWSTPYLQDGILI